MDRWKNINSKAIILNLDHVDTDMIYPAQHLTTISKTGHKDALFSALKKADPEFPFNKVVEGERSILVAGHNFGCGSSREHAVWAILQYGIRCVIAKSFGDIFKANSLKNGLLPVVVSESEFEAICKSQEKSEAMSVDLAKQEILIGDGLKINFEIDPFRKHCLLEGIDDLQYILELNSEISKFRVNQEAVRFFDTTWAVQ